MADPSAGATGSVTVYRDGAALGTGPASEPAEYPVPDQDASYRVVADARQSTATWPLSTVVTAQWAFRSSAAGDGTAPPMLTTRFDPAVDLRNRAPGNRRFSFPAHVERQDGPARIAALSVEVSYDDGATWRPAEVRPRPRPLDGDRAPPEERLRLPAAARRGRGREPPGADGRPGVPDRLRARAWRRPHGQSPGCARRGRHPDGGPRRGAARPARTRGRPLSRCGGSACGRARGPCRRSGRRPCVRVVRGPRGRAPVSRRRGRGPAGGARRR